MEITLYDKGGEPVAYIDEDSEHAIYLWGGAAVAYVENENVFGWNGKHLGWFADGILYDRENCRIGFVAEKCPSAQYAGSEKYPKYSNYARYAREPAPDRPGLSDDYSKQPLEKLLKQGAVD